MSRDRFKEILRFLRFDKKSTRSQRLQTDKFPLFSTEVGVAQNSLQVAQIAQVAQVAQFALRTMPFFSALAQFALRSMPVFFSACAICVALYAFFSALAQFAFANC